MAWYILLVNPGFEHTIKEQLLQKQKELSFQEVLISDEHLGYVFVRSIEINQQDIKGFLAIESTLRFLGTKKCPEKFTTAQIKKLSVANVELKPTKQIQFKVGDHVVVKNGDLADIDGEIVELKKRVVKIKPVYFQKIIKVKIQDIGFL
jgi:transcription antitermination factor NusG